jgi:hypothetical protein
MSAIILNDTGIVNSIEKSTSIDTHAINRVVLLQEKILLSDKSFFVIGKKK